MKQVLLKWLLIFTSVSTLLFNSCSNELDIIAPYKDTTIVYAMLSPNDSIQYIKIYKSFLGKGNAYQFAQVADSFYFPDFLTAFLVGKKNGETNDTIQLMRDTLPNATYGTFASAPNIAYTTTAPISSNKSYEIIIERKNHSTVSSSTQIPRNAYLFKPNTSNKEIALASDTLFSIAWQTGLNAKVYGAILRFNYLDVTPQGQTNRSIDWVLGQRIAADVYTKQDLSIDKTMADFYKLLNAKLNPPDSLSYRIAGNVEIIISGAAEDYYYYQKINNATVGVNQNIPNITNITNGLGLFSANTTNSWSFELDNLSYQYLRYSVYTAHLKFY
ncbi:MAG TPA: DUF4249 family protein [Bacteroidia bacterium]|nr:DUF4249 family protein [Bacteroidia bacterium]